MKKLRYAVIGTSKIATQYIAAARTTGQWACCAVYSRSQATGDAFAAQQGIAHVFCDLQAFAASDLFDAVYIASPNVLHYAHCKAMLAQGKHVICEKPFTSYLWQLEELFALAAQQNLALMEAMMFMHQPAKQSLERAIGTLGKLERVVFDNCRRSAEYDKLCGGAQPNVFNPALHTGALMDMGVYCLHPALALFGRPLSFDATATRLGGADASASGVDICGVVTLQYPDKIVILRYAKSVTSGAGSEILGANGRIAIGSILHTSDIVLHAPDGSQTLLWGENDKTTRMANEAADFARYLLQREDAAVAAEYQACKQASLLTCEYLAKIRKEIGLGF